MLTERPLICDGTTLNVAQSAPGGAPLVLLHGVTRRWQDFAPLLPALLWRWRVHALDFRGHGRSGRAADYHVTAYAPDVVAFLREHLPRPAVVYGHSLGAMVALAAAAEAPERVRALVLEDPPFDTMGPRIGQTVWASQFRGVQPLAGSPLPVAEVARQLAEVRLDTPGVTPSVTLGDVRDATALRFQASCLKLVDPAVLEPIVAGRWLDGYDRAALLERVRCPVLLLQADVAAGGMLTDADALAVKAGLADCTRVRLTGVGHLIHWTHADTALRLVTAFLESLSGW